MEPFGARARFALLALCIAGLGAGCAPTMLPSAQRAHRCEPDSSVPHAAPLPPPDLPRAAIETCAGLATLFVQTDASASVGGTLEGRLRLRNEGPDHERADVFTELLNASETIHVINHQTHGQVSASPGEQIDLALQMHIPADLTPGQYYVRVGVELLIQRGGEVEPLSIAKPVVVTVP